MSTGALLLPPGYHPLIDGAVVPSGKLYFYRTATTTAQDTFTDADLSVANSNPVILNATGGLDTLVYGDPTTGYRYRMRVYSSADALLDTHDDLLVWGANVPTFSESSFTGTLTGMDASTTGTVSYKIVANAAGVGKLCTLTVPSTFSGTSNTTAMTMTGLPAVCTPTGAVRVPTTIIDAGNENQGMAVIAAAGTTITFYTDANLSATGFTNSGGKGLGGGWTITYPL
jgi:hypothetical protein